MAKIPVYGISEFEPVKGYASFYVNDLKNHLQSHKFINKPHSHSTYITILFTKGTGVHHIDFQTYPVQPWTAFFLSPGQVHAWELSDDTDGYVFFHTRSFYNDVYTTNRIDDFPFFFLSQSYPLVEVPEASRLPLVQYFKDILKEKSEFLPHRELKIDTLVAMIYMELSRIYKNKQIHQESENYKRVRKLQKLIDTHYKTTKLPKDYSAMMHLSTRHLSRICNEILNLNTGDLIQERIVLEAKRLLTYSKDPIATIAYALGYEDVSYFNRLFKTRTSLTPKEFRDQTIRL